jgi:aspartyl-tRNA(Asn)/glutamyl-tRNA(Gln) amidotransferase subunit C
MLAFAMAAGFTRAQVEAIAALANLALAPSELDLFARQLGDVLAYAEEVQQVDTAGVPPTAHVATRHGSDRPDRVTPCLDRDAALANAPDAARGAGAGFFFRVPRVLG